MRLRAIGGTLLVLAAAAVAQDRSELARRFLDQEAEAFKHYHLQEWDAAVAAFERQIAIHGDNPRPYYNIACCYALQGDAERAGTWLRLAIAHEWRDADHLRTDPDFDEIRSTEAYRESWAQLEEARRMDPDPLPRRVPLAAVPSTSSARVVLTASIAQERLLRRDEDLMERHQLRRRLFRIYDRRIAMLTRYLAENGDAPDADVATHERVRTALEYVAEADESDAGDAELRRVGASYAVAMAEEFLNGYGGSPLLAEIRLWRASALSRIAGRVDEAKTELGSIVADHPRSEAAPRAQIRLCAVLADAGDRDALRAAYAVLERRFADEAWVQRAMRATLTKARLMAQGLPDAFAFDRREETVLYVFVGVGEPGSERRLESVRALAAAGKVRARVVCIDDPDRVSDDEVSRWLAEHAKGLETVARGAETVEQLWLMRVPTLVLARGGEVLAVDPTDDEIAALAR